mmetsp:Transcript_25309/g.72888  ORF Transcript_25309/g.72888 Transcript_25309/m.72888 type:complete len:247 (+) Transcript_25309:856-1596(+)
MRLQVRRQRSTGHLAWLHHLLRTGVRGSRLQGHALHRRRRMLLPLRRRLLLPLRRDQRRRARRRRRGRRRRWRHRWAQRHRGLPRCRQSRSCGYRDGRRGQGFHRHWRGGRLTLWWALHLALWLSIDAQLDLQRLLVLVQQLVRHVVPFLHVVGRFLAVQRLLLGHLHRLQSRVHLVRVVERQALLLRDLVQGAPPHVLAVVLRVVFRLLHVVRKGLPQGPIHDDQIALPAWLRRVLPLQPHLPAV